MRELTNAILNTLNNLTVEALIKDVNFINMNTKTIYSYIGNLEARDQYLEAYSEFVKETKFTSQEPMPLHILLEKLKDTIGVSSIRRKVREFQDAGIDISWIYYNEYLSMSIHTALQPSVRSAICMINKKLNYKFNRSKVDRLVYELSLSEKKDKVIQDIVVSELKKRNSDYTFNTSNLLGSSVISWMPTFRDYTDLENAKSDIDTIIPIPELVIKGI